MAQKPDQLVEAVAKLLALTQEGKIIWEADTRPGGSGLVALHRGQHLRIRKVTGKQRYYNEPPEVQVILEFIDGIGNSNWTFPEVEGLEDLYDAASYQASGVKDFLDDLLKGS
jgi:hypothetical protein